LLALLSDMHSLPIDVVYGAKHGREIGPDFFVIYVFFCPPPPDLSSWVQLNCLFHCVTRMTDEIQLNSIKHIVACLKVLKP